MYDKTDTDVIERDQETTESRKKERFFPAPLFMAMGVVLILVVVGMTIVSKAKREKGGKQAGVMAATYSARVLPQELVGRFRSRHRRNSTMSSSALATRRYFASSMRTAAMGSVIPSRCGRVVHE